MSLARDTAVLSVRFIRCHRERRDSSRDGEETDTDDQGLALTTDNDNDTVADDDDDDDVSTPQQVDWIVVTSHADGTIRFRNAQVNRSIIIIIV